MAQRAVTARKRAPIHEREYPQGHPEVIRVMVVAEPGLLRGALLALLAREDDIEVVADLASARGVCLDPAEHRPDVAVVDIDSPGGLAAVERVASHTPSCATVVLTARPTPRALRQALQAHARGFASKQLPPEDLVSVIRQVARGDRVIDPTTAHAALTAARNPLTPREVEVLRLAAEGLSSKAIGDRLFLTDGTVRNHMSAILRKTGTRSRLEAIRRADDAGWL
jgi:two-component system response regulator DesR